MAQRIIGLDLGSHEVKVVILDGGFRGFAARRCLVSPVPQDPPGEEERPLMERLQVALEALKEKEPDLFRADGIHTAVPGSLFATHVLTLPFTDARKIEQTLPFQLEDQIPFDLDEVIFDHQVLSQSGGKTELLVGVVKRETIADLLEMLSGLGADPRVVSLPPLAYQNLYAHGVLAPLSTKDTAEPAQSAPPSDHEEPSNHEEPSPDEGAEPKWAGTDDGEPSLDAAPIEEGRAEAVLDVGHSSTSMCILVGGRVKYARGFPVGGKGLSVAIGAALEMTLAEAEEIKHEVRDIVANDHERGAKVAAAVERGIAPLVRGVRQSFFAFRSRTRHRIDRVYLTGGTSRLPDLDQHLVKELGCEVVGLDVFPSHLERALPEGEEPDPKAGLAMALALRGQGGARTARVNFRKGPFAYKGDLSHLKGTIPRLAMIGALVVALLGANVFVRFQALSMEEARVDDQLCELTQRVLGACMTVPDDAISRLRGQTAAASMVPSVSSAEILSEVVRRLSQVSEIELRELDIGSSRVRLQGDAESFDAVARVVSELRGYECFEEVSQGQTRTARQSQKIEFNVDAVIAAQCGS